MEASLIAHLDEASPSSLEVSLFHFVKAFSLVPSSAILPAYSTGERCCRFTTLFLGWFSV